MGRALGVLAGALVVAGLLGCGDEESSSGAAAGGSGGTAGSTGTGGSAGAAGASGAAGGGGLNGDAGCVRDAKVTKDVPYTAIAGVDPKLSSLDVYEPARSSCDPIPIVVWVHGGAWAVGDKANGMTDKVALVNGQGWMLVSVNYRLSPNPPSTDPNRVMYPDHSDDVDAALAWIATTIGMFGGDHGRVALLGHSAGAHLVAFRGVKGSAIDGGMSKNGDGHIPCVGTFDTEAYDIPSALATASAQQKAILENAFGTDPAVQVEASPITHVPATVPADYPRFLIATRGDANRKALQEAFRKKLADAGASATMIDASALTHEDVNSSIGAPGDTIMTPPILTFLKSCLGAP